MALQYLEIMTRLGVTVGLAKSVISINGDSLEFAKKTLYKGKDVSPIPIKEYAAALSQSSALVEFVKKYSIPYSGQRALLGLGYRSSLSSLRWQMWQVLLTFPVDWKEVMEIYRRLSPYSKAQALKWKNPNYKSPSATVIDTYSNMARRLHMRVVQEINTIDNYRATLGNVEGPLYYSLFSTVYGKKLSQLWKENVLFKRELEEILPKLEVNKNGIIKNLDVNLPALLERVFDIAKKMSDSQLSSLIDPRPSSSPVEKDRQRMQRLWNTWSGVAIEAHQSSLMLLLPFQMIRIVIRSSRRMILRYTASRANRPLLLPTLLAGGVIKKAIGLISIWLIDIILIMSAGAFASLVSVVFWAIIASSDFQSAWAFVLVHYGSVYNELLSKFYPDVSSSGALFYSFTVNVILAIVVYASASMMNHLPEIYTAWQMIAEHFDLQTWSGVIHWYLSGAYASFLVFTWYPIYNLFWALASLDPQRVAETMVFAEIASWVPNLFGFLTSALWKLMSVAWAATIGSIFDCFIQYTGLGYFFGVISLLWTPVGTTVNRTLAITFAGFVVWFIRFIFGL